MLLAQFVGEKEQDLTDCENYFYWYCLTVLRHSEQGSWFQLQLKWRPFFRRIQDHALAVLFASSSSACDISVSLPSELICRFVCLECPKMWMLALWCLRVSGPRAPNFKTTKCLPITVFCRRTSEESPPTAFSVPSFVGADTASMRILRASIRLTWPLMESSRTGKGRRCLRILCWWWTWIATALRRVIIWMMNWECCWRILRELAFRSWAFWLMFTILCQGFFYLLSVCVRGKLRLNVGWNYKNREFYEPGCSSFVFRWTEAVS